MPVSHITPKSIYLKFFFFYLYGCHACGYNAHSHTCVCYSQLFDIEDAVRFPFGESNEKPFYFT